MTTELTSAGLTVDTQAEILADLETLQKAEISDTLDLSTSSPLGQLNRINARALRLLSEALIGLYAAMDPDGASGAALDRLAALTGSFREPAQKATVSIELDLDADTYAAGTLIVHVTGRAQDRFVNSDEVVSVGTPLFVAFEAETAGLMQAPVGAAGIYTIAGPISGWNSAGDSENGNAGTDAESDAAFRLRRSAELEGAGSTSAAGIRADIIANVPETTSVYVLENDTDATVDTIPPHAIEAVVFGPASPSSADNLAVATQILLSKAAGIGTSGNTSVDVTDSQGIEHTVSFTRPVDVDVDVEIELEMDAETYAGDAEVELAIEQGIQDLDPGRDVTWSSVAKWVQGVPGVLRITLLEIESVSLTDFSITPRQKAQPDTINITSVAGEP